MSTLSSINTDHTTLKRAIISGGGGIEDFWVYLLVVGEFDLTVNEIIATKIDDNKVVANSHFWGSIYRFQL